MYCSPFLDHLADPYSLPSYGFASSYLNAKNIASRKYIAVYVFKVSIYLPKYIGLKTYPNVLNGFDRKYIKLPTNGKLESISADASLEPCASVIAIVGTIPIASTNHIITNNIIFFFNSFIIFSIVFMLSPSDFFLHFQCFLTFPY